MNQEIDFVSLIETAPEKVNGRKLEKAELNSALNEKSLRFLRKENCNITIPNSKKLRRKVHSITYLSDGFYLLEVENSSTNSTVSNIFFFLVQKGKEKIKELRIEKGFSIQKKEVLDLLK